MSHDSLRPDDWDAYIGQTALLQRLEVYCRDAVDSVRPLPHVLLHGASGYGKTSLARLIAQRVRDPFFTPTWPCKPAALQAFFNRFERGVVLFDEFHRATKSQQEDLFTVLEDGYWATPNGRRIPIPWFTAILATTEPENIIEPILRRIPIRTLSFEPYTDEDLANIVRGMAQRLDVPITDEMAAGLGRAAGGRPGNAEGLVLALRALTRRGNTTVADVLDFCETDPDGITKNHRRIMAGIDKLAGVAAVGMDRLSGYVGLAPSVVRDTGNLLIERDLASYGPGGWELTNAGIRRHRQGATSDVDASEYRKIPAGAA